MYERAEAYQPRGAGLSLWPNAMRAPRAYEARRQPRTAQVAELSPRAGSLRYLRNPVARWGRDLLMQAPPPSVWRSPPAPSRQRCLKKMVVAQNSPVGIKAYLGMTPTRCHPARS